MRRTYGDGVQDGLGGVLAHEATVGPQRHDQEHLDKVLHEAGGGVTDEMIIGTPTSECQFAVLCFMTM
jgi:hypothetical protein